jgi:hypothetical protein|tara:strand:- start:33 stop:494 length:462 start_codon:yes stop_codon:yes gene_type:complete
MARPRIRQFAGDLGISYDEAKNLIKKGRGRKDGGSQILESNMKKMRGFEQGGTNKMATPTPLGPNEKMYRDLMGSDKLSDDQKDIIRKNRKLLDSDHPMNKEGNRKGGPMPPKPKKRGMTTAKRKPVSAASGKFMTSRGMGAAIQGGKFSGVY